MTGKPWLPTTRHLIPQYILYHLILYLLLCESVVPFCILSVYPIKKKNLYRREGEGHSCCLGDRIDSIPYHTIAILYYDDLKKGMNCTRMIWRKGWIYNILQILQKVGSKSAWRWTIMTTRESPVVQWWPRGTAATANHIWENTNKLGGWEALRCCQYYCPHLYDVMMWLSVMWIAY